VLSEVKSFGSFRLDTANHCLWRDAERVSITPKAYDVLCYLVENSGRLVKPDEMLEAIWADTYVNPEVLRKYILEIRKALGDKTDDPQFVETVPKRGYRFIAPVCLDGELGLMRSTRTRVPRRHHLPMTIVNSDHMPAPMRPI
jgi:DNA-binding winged helix-turn-helix (wHTH) protein